MKICPFCASENIFFSKKRNTYYCEDCENGFDMPSATKGMRVFLSYGHDKNARVVMQVKDYLIAHGFDVWMDTSEIPVGKDWRERITGGLMGSNGVISFLSRHSMRDPGVCLDEMKIAICMKRAYIKTVLLESEDTVDLPPMLKNLQWINMSDWESIDDANWNTYFEEKMSQLLTTLCSNEAEEFNGELEFLSGKLKVHNNTSKEYRLLKQCFVGREWLTERVLEWFASPGQDNFMIYGVPGAGKSAFSANLAQFNPDVVAALFFEWDHSELRDVDVVVRTLAFKLAATLGDYRRMLCSILQEGKNDLERYHGAALFDHIILNPLQCCIDGQRGKGMIIFDGLDETTPEISDLLIRKASHLPHWIKVLFTSRFSEGSARRFPQNSTVLLNCSEKENLQDIGDYFARRLAVDRESEIVRKLVQKSEGSFMYAVSFCDAIDNDDMTPEDANTLPAGLDSFYYTFFKRLFPTKKGYGEIRPLLELLCIDEDIPEEVLSQALRVDHFALWELRLEMKSLVVSSESKCGLGGFCKFKTLKLVHQSIKEWLTNSQHSGEFYIDVRRGYRRLADCCEELDVRTEEINLPYLDDATYQKLLSIDPQNVSTRQLNELKGELAAKRRENEEKLKQQVKRRELRTFLERNYIKCLILCGECDKAKALLLASFDADEMDRTHDASNYTQYLKFFDYWQWADLFPATYPIHELVEKLTEMVTYPHKYLVSRYAHRSDEICFWILRTVMGSGRYRDAFYRLMQFRFHAYFTSGASEDGETRDGWDKYFMTLYAGVCLKTLDGLGIPVPDNVRYGCEKMKLTFCHCAIHFYGESKLREEYYYESLLKEPEFSKDVCVLEENAKESDEKLQKIYNTTSLRLYLAESIEEDVSFVWRCVESGADLAEACGKAVAQLKQKGSSGTCEHRVRWINTLQQKMNSKVK